MDSTEDQGKEPTISDLVSLLRSHVGQQEAREARQKEENAQQEQRFRALQHQFQLLQLEVHERTTQSLIPGKVNLNYWTLTFQKLRSRHKLLPPVRL